MNLTSYGPALLAAALVCISCNTAQPPGAQPASATPPAVRSASASAAPVPSAPPVVSAIAEAGAPDAEPDAEAIDWKNKAKPELMSQELEQRARALLEAIVKDDPEIAKEFFFPREPFTPLKDVTNPDKYWVQLFGTYKRDIRELHRKRRDWTGAAFESFELGTPPTWVKPGDEYNKIGYYRTFRGRLRYTVGGKKGHIDVATIISWNKGWYVTHLAAIKH
jgi:hypothetical protein